MTALSQLINQPERLSFRWLLWSRSVEVRGLPLLQLERIASGLDPAKIDWYAVGELLEKPALETPDWRELSMALGVQSVQFLDLLLFFSVRQALGANWAAFWLARVISPLILIAYSRTKLLEILGTLNGLPNYLEFMMQSRYEHILHQHRSPTDAASIVKGHLALLEGDPDRELNSTKAYLSIYLLAKHTFGTLNGRTIEFDNIYSTLTYPQFYFFITQPEALYSFWLGLFGVVASKLLPSDGSESKTRATTEKKESLFRRFQTIIRPIKDIWRTKEGEERVKSRNNSEYNALYDLFARVAT